MDCYFCIVNLPGKMGADVCVLAAADDTAAMRAMAVQAVHWIGFETIFLYYGERFVGSLVDGHKGFPSARQDPASARSHRASGPSNDATLRRAMPSLPRVRKIA